MGRFRTGAFFGVSVAGGLIAFGASNCAAPTQIIVDVRAELSLCNGANAIQQTGIAVTTVARMDSEPLEIFEGPGCDGDKIGTLTITPSGDADAEVGIRVVAGVTKQAHQCQGPDWKGCIRERRVAKFTPNKTVVLTVYLWENCIEKSCGPRQECVDGECVDRGDIQLDGMVQPQEDGGLPDRFVSPDAPADAPTVDACSRCEGTGYTCTEGHKCNIDCDKAKCKETALCAEGLDCTITCPNTDKCKKTECVSSSNSCTFNCQGAQKACNGIGCSSSQCNVTCADASSACEGVALDGGINKVVCTNAENACDDVTCSGGTCSRTCDLDASACGTTTSCSGACSTWETRPDGSAMGQ